MAKKARRVRIGAAALVLGMALSLGVCSALVAPARAATGLEAMFEDDGLLAANPASGFAQLRMLGVQAVRFGVRWMSYAPSPNASHPPPHFNATDPSAYPAANWTTLDNLDRQADADGISLNFDVEGGAPKWAEGPGAPKGNTNTNWEPSPAMFQQFMEALGTRYSGEYDPRRKKLVPGDPNDLPRVSFWSVWNEPDYGPSLAPQGVPGHLTIENSPRMYRNLVDAAWTALHRTGHGSDTFIWGELAPRGMNNWGVFSGMKPLVFLRAMYCVDSRYRPLTGGAAAIRGCPTNAAGSQRFRAQNPALFEASGVSDHPYMRWYPPNDEVDPDPTNGSRTADYSSLGVIGNLERALDRLQKVYGSPTEFPIWDTEFAYITSPPKHDNQIEPGGHRYPWVSQTTAAYYLNWAEYISWRDPRMQSFFQYLLQDPLPALKSNDWGGFSSGLLNYNGSRKPGYYAWRMPLYLPVTQAQPGQSLEVWGCARPARFAALDTNQPQTVNIEFEPSGQSSFSTLESVPLPDASTSCYFDVPVQFPSSGTVRLSWDFPSGDPLLSDFGPNESHTAYSRDVTVTVS